SADRKQKPKADKLKLVLLLTPGSKCSTRVPAIFSGGLHTSPEEFSVKVQPAPVHLRNRRQRMISGLIWWILVGLIAGWLAGKVMKGSGFGVAMDIVVGIVGAIIGGWIFGRLGGFPFGGMLGTIVVAFAGAVIFLWLVRLIKKA